MATTNKRREKRTVQQITFRRVYHFSSHNHFCLLGAESPKENRRKRKKQREADRREWRRWRERDTNEKKNLMLMMILENCWWKEWQNETNEWTKKKIFHIIARAKQDSQTIVLRVIIIIHNRRPAKSLRCCCTNAAAVVADTTVGNKIKKVKWNYKTKRK